MRRTLVLTGLALLALGAVEWAIRSHRETSGPTAAAAWIWAADAPDGHDAAAFYAYRDFELEAAPLTARLLISVDVEYQLYLNGTRLGAGHYDGAELDEYVVGSLLQAGVNRLVVEARSRTGAGGILLAMFVDGMERPTLVSDPTWQIVSSHENGFLEGWSNPRESQPAMSWGHSPTGRWQKPQVPAGRTHPRPPVLDAQRGRWAASIEEIEVRQANDTFHPGVLVDFGEVVEGHLELWFEGGAPGRARWAWVSVERPRSFDAPAETERSGAVRSASASASDPNVVVVLRVPGRDYWRDVESRRFRYVLMSDHPLVASARVAPSDF